MDEIWDLTESISEGSTTYFRRRTIHVKLSFAAISAVKSEINK